MSVFWWEDGFSAKAKEDEVASRNKEQAKLKYDSSGEKCMLHSVVTDLHHLDGKFFNKTSDRFLMLNEAGRGRHARHFSISVYDLSSKNLELTSSFAVGENSGYIAISNDDSIAAVGVLKADVVDIYEISSGDLLINVKGGQRNGFWGCLYFLPGNNFNNSLCELRVTEMVKSKNKSSLIRMWDLGFRPKVDEDDESDDEVEDKLWEHKRPKGSGAVHYSPCGEDLLIFTSENPKETAPTRSGATREGSNMANSTVEWVSTSTGAVSHSIQCKKWASRTVVSRNNKYIAVGHFLHCSIYDAETHELVTTIHSPDPEEVYPVIPVTFMHGDEWLLMRINYNRNMLLCKWDNVKKTMLVLAKMGGTISDGCVQLSHDEKYLMSWPFGYLELFDFEANVKPLIIKKEIMLARTACLKLRYLVTGKRATVSSTCSSSGDHSGNAEVAIHQELRLISRIITMDVEDVFRIVLSFV